MRTRWDGGKMMKAWVWTNEVILNVCKPNQQMAGMFWMRALPCEHLYNYAAHCDNTQITALYCCVYTCEHTDIYICICIFIHFMLTSALRLTDLTYSIQYVCMCRSATQAASVAVFPAAFTLTCGLWMRHMLFCALVLFCKYCLANIVLIAFCWFF